MVSTPKKFTCAFKAGNQTGSHLEKTYACKAAATALTNPVTEPTDKSIFPVTITNTIPIAKKAIIVICLKRLERFCGTKKIP